MERSEMILLYSLVAIIIIHEGGHFIAAKLCKCHVEIFAVGFGKTIIEKKIGPTIYQLNWILFGGFCKLKDELELSNEQDSFTNKRYWQKTFIAYAGILMNVLTGLPAFLLGQHFHILWLYAFGWYSLAIGLSNALPIPCLDGFYPIIFSFEWLWGKDKTYKFWSVVCKKFFKVILILNILSIPYLVYLIIKGFVI
jgi:membrane-associated protease RseP (regulator of RpoE activity)